MMNEPTEQPVQAEAPDLESPPSAPGKRPYQKPGLSLQILVGEIQLSGSTGGGGGTADGGPGPNDGGIDG